MRHKPLVTAAAIAAAALFTAAPASAAIGNLYNDGRDAAVANAAPGNFRLSVTRLEPGCFPTLNNPHFDVGDSTTSIHLTNNDPTISVDQVLVPGQRTGYQVYNTFDTGSISNDPDIDTGQQALNLDAPLYRDGNTLKQDNVAIAFVIVCVSDHEDTGQNEPYAHSTAGGGDGVSDANEVYAKNRPILRPAVATLGQGAVRGIKGYKMGLGYSVERWYSLATITDSPVYSMRLTDPMGFSLDKFSLVGTTTTLVIDNDAGHVAIPARIAGPRFSVVTDGPGVLRVNDIDVQGAENFGDPHFEPSDYGQTDVFNVKGDANSFCLGGLSCAGILAFGAQGDLPITWSLKASLAAADTLRSVSFTPAQFDAWEQGWQDYYCGKGPHPTLPLTPGTNSPDPRGACPAVNQPETRPSAAPQVAVAAPVVTVVVPATKPAAKKVATKAQKAKYAKCVKQANKKHGKARTKARTKCSKLPH